MSKAAVTDQRGRSENKIVQILTKNPRITAFLVLAIASTVLSKGIFLSPANLHNMLRQYASIGIMAVGQTIVILLAGVDLSQGAMIALVSMVVAYLNVNGYGLIIPLLAGLGIGALGGFAQRNHYYQSQSTSLHRHFGGGEHSQGVRHAHDPVPSHLRPFS